MENKVNHIDHILKALAASFRASIYNEAREKKEYSRISDICYNHKGYNIHTINEMGQYGYYINEHAASYLYELIEKYSIKSFLDLGCGVGHLIWLLKAVTHNVNFVGYELEKELIDYAEKSLFSNFLRRKSDPNAFICGDTCEIHQQDILKMDAKEIKKFDVLYFYEPFYDEELAKQFVNHLSEVMKNNQLIFYTPAAYIGEYLHIHENFTRIERHGHVEVWQFKKSKTKNKSQDV